MLRRPAILLLWLLVAPTSAWAQNALRDDFEGPEISFRDPIGDGNFQIEPHRRTQQGPHSGRGCEQMTVRGNNSTYVYVSRTIGSARVIREFQATIWLKSDRTGLQFLARVVLPRSVDPRTGKPLSTLIRSAESAYKQAGVWQSLKLDNLPALVERQLRVLRAKFGPSVDAREAYVDRLLLNVYGGPGVTNVWVDDLEIAGIVPAVDGTAATDDSTDGPALALPNVSAVNSGASEPLSEPAPSVEFKNPLLLVAGRPFFMRSIDYQGEPLSRLAALGFNAVRTNRVPSPQLLSEAERAGLWLIAPPPPARALEIRAAGGARPPIDRSFDRVLAWDLGSGLSKSQLEATQRWAKLVDAADPRKRPILCDADSDLRRYTRPPVKLFLAHRDPLYSTLPLHQYGTWLRERSQLVVPGTPLWASVQTEPSQRLAEQMALLSAGRAVPSAPQESQIRMLVRIALASGARGLCFQSDSRVDARNPAAQHRAAILELINIELGLIDRWPAAGNLAVAATTSDASVSGGVLETDRSRLLLPIFEAAHDQFVMGNPLNKFVGQSQKLSLKASGVPEESAAWELTPTAFRRLPSKRVTGGTEVVLDESERDSMFVYTYDPAVVRALKERVSKTAARATQLTLEIAKTEATQLDAIEQRLAEIGRTIPAARRVRADAQKDLSDADTALKTNLPLAYTKSRLALSKLRDIERVHWEKAQSPTASPLGDPLAACLDTLHEHYRFDHEMASAARGPNRVPEAIFEQLEDVQRAGWRYYQHAPEHIATFVEVSPRAAHSGSGGLRLRAALVDPKAKPGVVETPPLWITSAPVNIQRGDVFQIEGWVRTPGPIVGGVDGLLIVDTLSGEGMAQRITNTENKWVEFTIYRAAAYSGAMSVTFALSGLGEACIDDVSIQVIERRPTGPPQQAQRTPPVSPTGL